MMTYEQQQDTVIANNMSITTENVKAENEFDGLELSDEQMGLLLDRAVFEKQEQQHSEVFKLEDVKPDMLAFTSSHFVRYREQDGKHVKTWQCAICSKEFSHQYTLMRHLPTHTDERKYTCGVCGKAFRQMSTLSQHRAIHSAERPYVCDVCEKTFNRVSTLISHRKTHTGQKPHQCHLCNKAFHQKGNLRNHIFTHTNERPYKCEICKKGFNQMSNLMCHKLKAHQRSDSPRYTCQICGKDFQKRIALRNHEQCQHGVHNHDAGFTMIETPRIRYTNGVVVEPIKTEAMQHALSINETPFALLRPLNGIPVLVRVLPAGDKQMLVPATAEDLKKHGQISIIAKGGEEENTKKNEVGSTVQIKIPVVATVIQRRSEDGSMCMMVQSPGPSTDTASSSNDSTYVFTGNESDAQEISGDSVVSDAQIEYMDAAGNIITEEEFHAQTSFFQEDLTIENVNENQQNSGDDLIMDVEENKENINSIIHMLEKADSNDVVETLVEISDDGNTQQ